jgi:hypothetical protein
MIFGNFIVSRELEGLSVKLKNARFGPLWSYGDQGILFI